MPAIRSMRKARGRTIKKSDPCNICGLVLSRANDLPRHAKRHAPDDEKLACTWTGCDFKTLQKSNLNTHFRRHTNEKPFICDVCSFETCDPACLSRHKKRHGRTSKKYEKPNKHVPVRLEVSCSASVAEGMTRVERVPDAVHKYPAEPSARFINHTNGQEPVVQPQWQYLGNLLHPVEVEANNQELNQLQWQPLVNFSHQVQVENFLPTTRGGPYNLDQLQWQYLMNMSHPVEQQYLINQPQWQYHGNFSHPVEVENFQPTTRSEYKQELDQLQWQPLANFSHPVQVENSLPTTRGDPYNLDQPQWQTLVNMSYPVEIENSHPGGPYNQELIDQPQQQYLINQPQWQYHGNLSHPVGVENFQPTTRGGPYSQELPQWQYLANLSHPAEVENSPAMIQYGLHPLNTTY